MLQLSDYHSYFVFGRSQIQILAQRLTIMANLWVQVVQQEFCIAVGFKYRSAISFLIHSLCFLSNR
jgi:hypothetical protein